MAVPPVSRRRQWPGVAAPPARPSCQRPLKFTCGGGPMNASDSPRQRTRSTERNTLLIHIGVTYHICVCVTGTLEIQVHGTTPVRIQGAPAPSYALLKSKVVRRLASKALYSSEGRHGLAHLASNSNE